MAAVRLGLTLREVDVLRVLADGASSKQIGRRLGIASSTIDCHVRKICAKVGVNTRLQLVARARDVLAAHDALAAAMRTPPGGL